MIEEIRETIADLRQAWAWLDDLVEPGRDSAPIPVMTDGQRAGQAAAAAAEQAEREWATRAVPVGQRQFVVADRTALAGSRSAARIGVIDARVAVHGMVLDVARMVAAGMGARYVGGRHGDAAVADALDWLDGGPPCWIATITGEIWRTPPGGVLAQVDDPLLADAVDRRLQRALRVAQEAARAVEGEHLAPVDHRCPACGQRSLQLDYVSEESLREGQDYERARRRWTVTCVSEACRCAGEGCWCRQRIRYAGRRHAWTYAELSGPYGLWAAIRGADRRRRGAETRVRSESAGHGGWAERRAPTRVGRAVRDRDGVLWWDRDRACVQLGIKPHQLWDWVRRGATESSFPRLDPPWRDGKVSWYQAQQVLNVEWHLTQATRGRTRSA